MTRVLTAFAFCLFSIAAGVTIMLTVASQDASDVGGILLRHAAGGVLLLAPALVQRWRCE